MKKRILCALMTVICVCLCSSCTPVSAPSEPEEPARDPAEMMNVYLDDLISVDAGGFELIESEGCCVMRLCLTSTSDRSVAVSSALCVRLTSDGNELETVPLPAGYKPVDGLLRPGGTLDGYVAFAADAVPDDLSVDLAMNYAEDDWISFACLP